MRGSVSEPGAFEGFVAVGTVISYADEYGQMEKQGVVVLPYVRLSASASQGLREVTGSLCSVSSAGSQASPLEQLLLVPTPVPMVLLLPLRPPTSNASAAAVSQTNGAAATQCWQMGTDTSVVAVRTQCITRLWASTELGKFGSALADTVSPKTGRAKRKVRADVLPSTVPTALRLAIEHVSTKRAVVEFVLKQQPQTTNL
jgi:hypothetical protein